ncbi:hypothetical protein BH23PLA1_BH23PLA1_15420 [soil metagenome]
MTLRLREAAQVHVRFEGRSLDAPLAEFDLGPTASEAEVKATVARWLEVPVARLAGYVVDRHETGNLTIRPEAVFG